MFSFLLFCKQCTCNVKSTLCFWTKHKPLEFCQPLDLKWPFLSLMLLHRKNVLFMRFEVFCKKMIFLTITHIPNCCKYFLYTFSVIDEVANIMFQLRCWKVISQSFRNTKTWMHPHTLYLKWKVMTSPFILDRFYDSIPNRESVTEFWTSYYQPPPQCTFQISEYMFSFTIKNYLNTNVPPHIIP